MTDLRKVPGVATRTTLAAVFMPLGRKSPAVNLMVVVVVRCGEPIPEG